MNCLIVVDVQKDFLPGGSTAVPQGDRIIPRINQLIAKFVSAGDMVIYTKDSHPVNHVSFKEHGGMWPLHCVKFSDGWSFPNNLLYHHCSPVALKGEDPKLDSYSAFGGHVAEVSMEGVTEFPLTEVIYKGMVEKITIVGLATDYCVKATALDALKLRLPVTVDLNACAAVNVKAGDEKRALDELKAAGAKLVGR